MRMELIYTGGVAELRLTVAALLARGVLRCCAAMATLHHLPRMRLTGAHKEEEEQE